MAAQPHPDNLYAAARRHLDAIELELRRLGYWQASAPAPERLDFERAFGADKLSFLEWLQWVLLPRVGEIIAGRGTFPGESAVGAYAVRELDGMPGGENLVSLLCEFDALFEEPEPEARGATPVAGPFANHEEARAALIAANVISPIELAVRGYLIAIQVGNAQAARSHLLPPHSDDGAFAPQLPFTLYDFRLEQPVIHGAEAEAECKLAGTDDAGAAVRQTIRFALRKQQGEWRIDFARTTALPLVRG
jgi:uncharacterized protein YqcC (DUF446 family)